MGIFLMSYDLAVWYPYEHLTDEEAGLIYLSLCNEDVSRLQPHPSIHAFYNELASLHPEVDDVPEEKSGDFDFSPWSIEHDYSDRHIIMCSVWSKAEYVAKFVRELAGKHGLAVYNPQEYRIYYPGDS